MDAVSSLSSANEYGLQQLRMQQARRDADQAEQAARSLRAQADGAQRVAEEAQESARTLGVQSDQAEARAGQARQGLASVASTQQAITQLTKGVNQAVVSEPVVPVVQPSPQGGKAAVATAGAAPVVNAQGQVTGTIVNTSA